MAFSHQPKRKRKALVPKITLDQPVFRRFDPISIEIGKWLVTRRNRSCRGAYEFRWNKTSSSLGFEFMVSFPREQFENYTTQLSNAVRHESPVAIHLLLGRAKLLAELPLNFARVKGYGKSLLLEGIQGMGGKRTSLAQFAEKTEAKWANHLIKRAIDHARKCGLESVGIIDPKSLYWFQKPSGCRTEAEVKEVQTRIMGLYKAVAKKLGFDTEHPARTSKAVYWMKKL